jgi:hypothetical protein
VQFESEATKWGCFHESIAREQFIVAMEAFNENCRVEDVGFVISPEKPSIGASPGQATSEIKCPCFARNVS